MTANSVQEEVLQELTSTQIEKIKRKCQTDLYFLAKTVLGYDQVHYDTHNALCNFIVNEESNRRMILMSRGFLKSTLSTISDSIRLAICDPNTRILIANETYEKACDFLKEIKGHWRPDTSSECSFLSLYQRGLLVRDLTGRWILRRSFGLASRKSPHGTVSVSVAQRSRPTTTGRSSMT